jgi:translation initiation factor IF-2
MNNEIGKKTLKLNLGGLKLGDIKIDPLSAQSAKSDSGSFDKINNNLDANSKLGILGKLKKDDIGEYEDEVRLNALKNKSKDQPDFYKAKKNKFEPDDLEEDDFNEYNADTRSENNENNDEEELDYDEEDDLDGGENIRDSKSEEDDCNKESDEIPEENNNLDKVTEDLKIKNNEVSKKNSIESNKPHHLRPQGEIKPYIRQEANRPVQINKKPENQKSEENKKQVFDFNKGRQGISVFQRTKVEPKPIPQEVVPQEIEKKIDFKLIKADVGNVKEYVSSVDSEDLLQKRREAEKADREKSKTVLRDKKKNANLRSGLLGISTDENDIQGEILNRTFIKKKPKAKQQNKSYYQKQVIVQQVVIDGSVQLKELANSMNLKATELIKALNKIEKKRHYEDDMIEPEMAELLVLEFGHEPILKSFKTIDSLIEGRLEKSSNNLKKRPPVVTIMGHVDHGKTSLLDAFRSSNVVDQESGGITQHIGAYQITTKSGEKISFIDTPGHEAFTAIRARGSRVTDIVILVVAADDGVMPQTIESINHIHAAKVPVIVAVNKIDKTNGNIKNIITQLMQHEIIVEEFGGETMCVPISAKNKTNLDKLEDAIILQAEMLDLKADFDCMSSGVVIESKINNARGSCATLLVQNGSLKIGDCMITSDQFCKVRSMLDEHGRDVEVAEPSMAVEVFGFQKVPETGQKFVIFNTEKEAKENLDEIVLAAEKQKAMGSGNSKKGINLASMIGQSGQKSEVKELKFIIKADVTGTIEAVKYSLEKLNTDELRIEVIHSGTGTVNDSDVSLAKTTGAVIAGFNVSATSSVQSAITSEGITFRIYNIIYQLIDDVADMVKNKLKPQKIEKYIGKLIVKKIFDISKTGKIAGCLVSDGSISTNNFVKILRKGEIIAEELKISVLKRFKENVREVKQGLECGVALKVGEKEFDGIQEGDTLETYNIIENK